MAPLCGSHESAWASNVSPSVCDCWWERVIMHPLTGSVILDQMASVSIVYIFDCIEYYRNRLTFEFQFRRNMKTSMHVNYVWIFCSLIFFCYHKFCCWADAANCFRQNCPPVHHEHKRSQVLMQRCMRCFKGVHEFYEDCNKHRFDLWQPSLFLLSHVICLLYIYHTYIRWWKMHLHSNARM